MTQMNVTQEPTDTEQRSRAACWLKRFGVAGFLFFLIKGLMWLIVPAAVVAWGSFN